MKIFRFYFLLISIFGVKSTVSFADALMNQVVHRFFDVNSVACGAGQKDKCLVSQYKSGLPVNDVLKNTQIEFARCGVDYDLSSTIQAFDPNDKNFSLLSSQIPCVKNESYENACWVSYAGVVDGYHNVNICYAKHGLPKKPLVECKNIIAGKSENVNDESFRASLVYLNEHNNSYALRSRIADNKCPDLNNINGMGYYYILETMLRGGSLNDAICDEIKRGFKTRNNLECPDEAQCPCDDDCKNNNFIPTEISKSFGCESDCLDVESIDGQKQCKLCRLKQNASEKIKKGLILLTNCYECNQRLRQIEYYCKRAYRCENKNPYLARFRSLSAQVEKDSYINFMKKIYGSGAYVCVSSNHLDCGCAKVDYIGGPRHMPRVALKSNTRDYINNPAENLFDTQPYVRPFYDENISKNNSVCGSDMLPAERGYAYRGTFFRPKLIVRYGSGETTIQFLGKNITDPKSAKQYYVLSKVDDVKIPYLMVAPWAMISKVAEKDVDISTVDTKSSLKLTIDERRDVYTNGRCISQKKDINNPTIDIVARLEYDARSGASSIVAYSIRTVSDDPSLNISNMIFSLYNGDKVVLNNNGRIYRIIRKVQNGWDVYTNIGSVPRPPLKYFYNNNGTLISPIKIQELPDSYNNYVSDYVNPVMMTLQPGVLQGSVNFSDEFGDEKNLPPEIDRTLVITNWVPASFTTKVGNHVAQGVFDKRCTFLYGHRFCINDNDCDALLNISNLNYLIHDTTKPNISSVSLCNGDISCITAVILRDRCTAYIGCDTAAKSIGNSSIDGCQRVLSPFILTPTMSNVGAGDVKHFMVQKDFRFAQSICISDGIKVPDSRTNDASANDFIKFGQYGDRNSDYVLSLVRPSNSIVPNVNAPMRPLTNSGLNTILFPDTYDQLDSPYDIIPVKDEFFTNINNVLDFLRKLKYYDRVNNKMDILYNAYKQVLDDCDKKGSCGDKITIRKRLFEEMPFGTFCITKSNSKGNTWLLKESRRTQRDYDIYIPARCQYMTVYSGGAGGAGVVTTQGVKDNTCNIDNEYEDLNQQPKYSSTGRAGSVVMRVINFNKIRGDSYGDGDSYLSAQIGERTGRCNVEFIRGGDSGSAESLSCIYKSGYRWWVKYSGGCHDYRALFDKDDRQLDNNRVMLKDGIKDFVSICYDNIRSESHVDGNGVLKDCKPVESTYNSVGLNKGESWRGDSVVSYFYDDYDYKVVKLFPIVEAMKGLSAIDVMIKRSEISTFMYEDKNFMQSQNFDIDYGYLVLDSFKDSNRNTEYPPRITGLTGTAFGNTSNEDTINATGRYPCVVYNGNYSSDLARDDKNDKKCLGQQLRFARANEVYPSHLSKYKSFKYNLYSLILSNSLYYNELPSSRVGFSRVFQGWGRPNGNSYIADNKRYFKFDWYVNNFRVPDFNLNDPDEVCKGGFDITKIDDTPSEYECYFSNGMKPSLCVDSSFADSPMCKNIQSVKNLYNIPSPDGVMNQSGEKSAYFDPYNQYNTVDSGAGAFYELGQGGSNLNKDRLQEYTNGPRASGAGGTGWVKMYSAGVEFGFVNDENGVQLYQYPIINSNGEKTFIKDGKKDRQCKVRCPAINVKHFVRNIQLSGMNYTNVEVICEYSGSEGTDMEVAYGSVVAPKKCVVSSSSDHPGLKGAIIKMNNVCPIMKCVNSVYNQKYYKLNNRLYGVCLQSVSNREGGGELWSIFDSDVMVYSGMALENYETSSVLSNLLSLNKSGTVAVCAKSSTYYLNDSLVKLRGFEYQLRCDQNGFWGSKYLTDNKIVTNKPYLFTPNSSDLQSQYKAEYNNTHIKSISSDFVIHERSAFNNNNPDGLFLGYFCPPIEFEKYDYDVEYSGGTSWPAMSERNNVVYSTKACGSVRNDLTYQKSISNISGVLPSRACKTNGIWGGVLNPCGVTCPDPTWSLPFPSAFNETNPVVNVGGRNCNLATGKWVD
ncbi:MAG: hypothetical protein RL208_797 [Pseudomonadota bacterium]